MQTYVDVYTCLDVPEFKNKYIYMYIKQKMYEYLHII